MVSQKSRKLPKSVRSDEFRKLLKVVKDQETKVLFLLAYGCGLRVSEVKALRPEHFRDNPPSIFVKESKYGVERVVPVPKGWRKEFIKHIPFKISIRSMQRRFMWAKTKAKLNPSYSFHSLRHGFALRAVESGIPPNQLQLLMGHSDLKTTSVYTKAHPKDALKSYEDLF